MTGETPACPRCNAAMVECQGPYGGFWGCSQFPKCRGSRSLQEDDIDDLDDMSGAEPGFWGSENPWSWEEDR